MYQSFATPDRSSENDVRESKNVKSTSVPVDTEIKQILSKQAQEQTSQPKTALERALCDPKCVIRLKTLLEMLGVSRSTVYLRINPQSKYYDPMFPKSIPLGMKAKGWVLEDVHAYIEHLRNQAEIA
ncbi:helix-turn-helix transcriptional regulator [Comamonas thiooxydans]|uniref:helix-turn-helix transcriptional regulator n=1 Tax=Comamonas thiooxydans TaxID=363952 RepID=UPI0006A8B5F5|nr:AlpA family phage regulatory protein [Comamonas thiooxydans]CUB01865.1 transcriptional regulator, AlpA family [Comamonas thiooxydans]